MSYVVPTFFLKFPACVFVYGQSEFINLSFPCFRHPFWYESESLLNREGSKQKESFYHLPRAKNNITDTKKEQYYRKKIAHSSSLNT